ncbi:aminotransferase class I/II-fold pyridoxal phosphate-dependent enzyme [Salinimonas marina]|uniref:cysteine-S-conjugate beta-lyase n=1 Tax=Salinimonas marina TaxID=2785918 RepID=A0A7S9DZX3_9ALTE|nr:aminotransferase class I/II-fold pyridoxal phosphate-dependent enzyme [Salinimonas marina]QPG06917.1 aminotransferase class I/II-fold pyridoxal phosphate-dependent enzyme [Salinimonas marina]
MQQKFGVSNDSVLSMWIADMDVALPSPVSQAVAEYVHSDQVGYQHVDIATAVETWLRQQGVKVAASWLVPVASVVTTLWRCINMFSSPGERVGLFTPVYGPFFPCITEQQRQIVELDWRWKEDTYRPDLSNLPTDLAMLLICQPNNPTGSVWNYDELEVLARHCQQHNIVLISDEVHRDFAFDTPVSSVMNLPAELKSTCIMLGSPAKTFNLAGVGAAAYAITTNPDFRHRLMQDVARHHQQPGPLASLVTNTAYLYCTEWFKDIKHAIAVNRQIIRDAALSARFSLYLGPATYFAWLDATALGDDAKDTMLNHYQLALGDGAQFGAPGYFRLNLATHPDIVREVLARLNSR